MADSDTGVYLHDTIKFNDRISVIFELLVTEWLAKKMRDS